MTQHCIPTSIAPRRSALPLHCGLRRGFSFVEVLFAVMILGVGFIMIAAIFPVALTQTKSTTEEANAASIARAAVNYVEPRANGLTLEPTNNAVVAADFDPSRDGSLFDALQGNMIPPTDQRFAWIVLYRRAGTHASDAEPYAQIYLFPVETRNQSTYLLPPGLTRDTSNNSNTRGTASISASITDSGNAVDADRLTFNSRNTGGAGPGSYVLIADADSSGANQQLRTSFNGRIYRLGNQISANQFELAPGNDFTPENIFDGFGRPTKVNGLTNVQVFVVGQGLGASGNFEGAGQDISAYTTFVQVK